MSLGLEQGEAVAVQVSGRDEERTCRQLVELFETRFDFPRRS
jgi:phosphotransferase system HPr-like phosphotransfer protein